MFRGKHIWTARCRRLCRGRGPQSDAARGVHVQICAPFGAFAMSTVGSAAAMAAISDDTTPVVASQEALMARFRDLATAV